MKEQFDLYTNHDTGMLLLPEEKRRVLHQAIPILNGLGVFFDVSATFNVLKERNFPKYVYILTALQSQIESRYLVDLDQGSLIATDSPTLLG